MHALLWKDMSADGPYGVKRCYAMRFHACNATQQCVVAFTSGALGGTALQ
jgi:hypothetical protein